jgi:hypothetical protein
MKVGTYAGDGNNDRSIAGLGFKPAFAWTKGADTTAGQYGVLRTDKSYGDESQLFYGPNQIDCVQAFENDGFQIGTDVQVNENGKIYYYAAFSGVPAPPAPSGKFVTARGSYLGNGGQQFIGLEFSPDLVIVKSGSTNYAVFTTSLMPAGYSAYFGANGMITGAITLHSGSFEVGTDPNVNASGTYYYWTAFGGSGSTDFKVGAYSGTGVDDRSITGVGFQPNLVVTKRYNTNQAVWRTSAMVGDNTSYFSYNNPDAPNLIQALESDGFQVGTGNESNILNYTYYYFAFKQDTGYFKVGTYTGNGTSQYISGLGGKPNHLWVKSALNDDGVHTGANIDAGYSQFFRNVANATGRVQQILPSSFEVGSDDDVNNNGRAYWYASWLSTPASVEFIVQPTGTEVSDPITPAVVVRIVDQFGSIVDYDNSTSITVSLFANPGGATLSGTLSATVSGGVATFEGLSLDKVGNGYVLQAAAAGLATGYSNSFNVGPGQGNKLAFVTQPATTAAGSTISPAVQVAVKDNLGNTVTTDNTSQITLALQNNPTGATLSGTLTRTASSGVAAFDDLSVNRRGAGYTLLASAPYITSSTSEGFDITAESTAPYVVSYAPTGEGVSVESKVMVRFSEDMDQSSVQNAFSAKAIRNNLGDAINTPISGTFSWPSPEAVEFTPSSTLENNYVYQVQVSTEARDPVGNPLSSALSFSFTTVSKKGSINAFVGDDGKTKLSFPADALDVDFYAKISTSPETDPIFVDPSGISAADSKVAAENDRFKFMVDGSAREFAVFDSAGGRITSAFNRAATITLPYTDADGDGFVDGTSPRIRADALRICRLDENNSLWIIYPEATLDTSAKTVSTTVKGLSAFALMARGSASVSEAFAFPNPFRPADGHANITFTNLATECTIKIFTLTGSAVKTLVENDGDRECVWNVKNEAGETLQSGLYIYMVKSSDDTKIGKLVVIR